MAKKKTKTAKKVHRAMKEVFAHPPRKGMSRKQKVAIGLNKARARGARVPKR